MPTLRDNLRGWRDAAEIDWFSQFIKAWIPFNAWMTDTFGDLSDRELLDEVKAGSNVVFNGIVPLMDPNNDTTQSAQEFRFQISELHRLLQGCIVTGRKGRVSFESVDIGKNHHLREPYSTAYRALLVERNVPQKGNITLQMSDTRTSPAFHLVQVEYNRTELEDNPTFQKLKTNYRSRFLSMYETIAPRLIRSVLTEHSEKKKFIYGTSAFIADPEKLFSALVDVIYSLRNALFHGSITPNQLHNEIYSPAYHIVLRMVRCTL